MREELLQKLHSLQERKRLMCSRSTKIREVELKRKIINDVLEIVPNSSATATCLRAIEFEVNKQDITLRPWKQRKLMKSVDSTNKTSLLASVDINASTTKDLSRIHAESLHKGTLEWRLNHAIDSGQVDLAEKISDSIGNHLLSTTSSDKNIHLTLSKQDEYKEELKNRRPVWLFQAKERWEAKSNM
ncbi:unnamed protein product [Schistosoma margrebowiei]|uniref:Uncharacterized protein n=1 Tax=Schistosoma margrebowiei TaxID=48269 RepID=A0AA84ZWB2_9TREM|nr:unnamed protein product [Schistosoma margrebowiei]